MTRADRQPEPLDITALRESLAHAGEGWEHQPIGLERIHIGPEALDRLETEIEAVRRPGPVVLVMDETPMRRGDTDLKADVARRLVGAFDANVVVLRAHGTELHADADALAQADAVVGGAGCVVALGSGTVTDIAKDATFRADRAPFVVVQTAVSVNAFSDDMAVLLRDGVKRTVPSRWPDVLIVDLEVIAAAPAAMNRAGFGELCSMFTAPADWYLAAAIGMDDAYDPSIVALFRDGGEGLLAGAGRVRGNDPAMLAELASRMTLTGIAMGVAGRTAPLSGTEHLLSHLLDMSAAATGRPVAFHGAQVGVAAVLAATLWEDTLDRFDPSVLAAGPSVVDQPALERRVRQAFDPLDPSGRMATECLRDVARKVERWNALGERLSTFAADWPVHRDALRALVATPAEIAAALQAAGAPADLDDLEPPTPTAVATWAVRSIPLMRDRFTVGDLRLLTDGWTDETADALLERSGILGRAEVVR